MCIYCRVCTVWVVCVLCVYILCRVRVVCACVHILCVCVEGTGDTEGGRGSRREKDGAEEEGYQAGETDKDEEGPGGRQEEGGKA